MIQHPQNFRTPFVPIFLCLLHLMVNFANELIMIIAILHDDDVLAMLGDFTGVYIVSEIPSYYFAALDNDLKSQMTETLSAKSDMWSILEKWDGTQLKRSSSMNKKPTYGG